MIYLKSKTTAAFLLTYFFVSSNPAFCAENTYSEAHLGDIEAQYQLGALYFEGQRNAILDHIQGIDEQKIAALEEIEQHLDDFYEVVIDSNSAIDSSRDQNLGDLLRDPNSFMQVHSNSIDSELRLQQERNKLLSLVQLHEIKMTSLGERANLLRIQLSMQSAVDRANSTEAIKWFKQAATQGHKLAQFRLGKIYTEGHGVPEDSLEGFMWFRLAEILGHPEAAIERAALEAILTEAQLTLGETLVNGIASKLSSKSTN
jgi:TPR repeat protein